MSDKWTDLLHQPNLEHLRILLELRNQFSNLCTEILNIKYDLHNPNLFEKTILKSNPMFKAQEVIVSVSAIENPKNGDVAFYKDNPFLITNTDFVDKKGPGILIAKILMRHVSLDPNLNKLIFQHSDGTYYSGEHQQSLPHGMGYMRTANGDEYFGEWEQGKYNGLGLLRKAVIQKQIDESEIIRREWFFGEFLNHEFGGMMVQFVQVDSETHISFCRRTGDVKSGKELSIEAREIHQIDYEKGSYNVDFIGSIDQFCSRQLIELIEELEPGKDDYV